MRICGLHLVESDDAETGIVGIGRIGERDGERPDGPGDEALAASRVGDAIGPFAALARGLLVDVPGELVEELVLDDAFVEFRILAPAALARIFAEEFALRNRSSAESVGFDNVGAGLKEAPMDIADHGGLRERE